MDLRKYVSLMKNLRGILLFDPDQISAETVSLIARYHRYRKVGVLGELVCECPEDVQGALNRGCYVRIDYPDTSFTDLQSDLDGGIPIKCLLLASIYISPLFIAEGGRKLVSPFETLSIESWRELDLSEMLRHIRIASYSQIDFHDAMTEGAIRAIGTGDVDGEVLRRREWAKMDRDSRFWRLLQHSNNGVSGASHSSTDGSRDDRSRWVGGYYDILLAENIRNVVGKVTPMTGIALGMVVGLTVLISRSIAGVS